jgi:3-deoxy-D-manno-octulosonic acid kinase
VRLPAGYVLVAARHVRAAVRRDLEPALSAWLLADPLELPSDATPFASGRGAAWRVALPGVPRAVVRLYRRGGLAARVSRQTYLGVRERPLRELVLTAEARRRGVAAAEVLAARVEGRLAYRGALVTAEVPGAATLLEALRAAPDAGARGRLLAEAARAVAAMHAAGVWHADLNLTNILVHPGPDGPAVALLDFDRARLARGPLGAGPRRRNLRRLARSLAKLDPAGALAGPEERRAFRAAYAPGGRTDASCGC